MDMQFKLAKPLSLLHNSSWIVLREEILMAATEAGWMMSLITLKSTRYALNRNIPIKHEIKNATIRNAL